MPTVRHAAAAAALAVGLLTAPIPGAAAEAPAIAPVTTAPGGLTYGEWEARWWQWALQAPAPVNPLTDTTGEHCRVSQSGPVWFLAGSSTAEPVVRTCHIPAGKSLFFPIINSFSGALLSDPPKLRKVSYLRSTIACVAQVKRLALTVDGAAARQLHLHLVASTVFDVHLPRNNIFGLTPKQAPKLLVSPTVGLGYYVFMPPLSPGRHEIHFRAAIPCFGGFSQDISYSLTVGGSS
jgi:hypothetical protein